LQSVVGLSTIAGMRTIVRLLALMLVIGLAPQLTSGIRVDGLGPALLAAVVYSVLAVLIGWLVRFGVTLLSIVPGLLTFGLFFLLVPLFANAVLLKLTAGMIARFEIRTWTAAFVLSIAITIVNAVFDRKPRGADRDSDYERRHRRA
jgi:putative membrane protein